jgi:hypothetical protein
MMKRPTETDFETKANGAAIEVLFKPTGSVFVYYRLADPADIERVGPVSEDPLMPQIRDFGDYSAESHLVFAMARAAAVRFVENERKIFADSSHPATLRNGGRATACPTLHEAVLAWMRLPEKERAAATIRADDGVVYNAEQIDRLHHGRVGA